MAQQTVTLNPGASKKVSFWVTPNEARTYHVTVDGLSGSFTAQSAISGPEITSYTNPCSAGAFFEVWGKNLDSGAYEVSSYWKKGITFVSLLPFDKSSTHLAFDLAKSYTLKTTLGDWTMYIGVIRKQGEPEMYSNQVVVTLVK